MQASEYPSRPLSSYDHIAWPACELWLHCGLLCLLWLPKKVQERSVRNSSPNPPAQRTAGPKEWEDKVGLWSLPLVWDTTGAGLGMRGLVTFCFLHNKEEGQKAHHEEHSPTLPSICSHSSSWILPARYQWSWQGEKEAGTYRQRPTLTLHTPMSLSDREPIIEHILPNSTWRLLIPWFCETANRQGWPCLFHLASTSQILVFQVCTITLALFKQGLTVYLGWPWTHNPLPQSSKC